MYNDIMIDLLPITPDPIDIEKIKAMNPAVLAFVGDAVQTLFERVKQATQNAGKTALLHRNVAAKISATSQALAFKNIKEHLSAEEEDIYKRCRNCKTNTSAKNASIVDYKVASGFEGVIGYLYLLGRHDRLLELLRLAYK